MLCIVTSKNSKCIALNSGYKQTEYKKVYPLHTKVERSVERCHSKKRY